MRRRKLVGERIISDRIPKSPIIDKHSASVLALRLSEFVDKYLRGAATVSVGRVDTGTVSICTYFTAYLIRLTVEHLAIDSPIEIKYAAFDGFLRLRIDYEGEADEEALALMSRVAADAGFEAVMDDGVIAFMSRFVYTAELSLYATEPKQFYYDLCDIFFLP